MSIAEQNRVRELEAKVSALEARVVALEQDSVGDPSTFKPLSNEQLRQMVDNVPLAKRKTLGLPGKTA